MTDTHADRVFAIARGSARLVTELCAPWLIVVGLPLAIAWKATHAIGPMLGWGMLVATTSSLLPMSVILWGARSRRWDGHHVRNREGRAIPFVALIGFSGIGLMSLVFGGAPHMLIALDVAMLWCLVSSAAITIRWKISMHAATGAGAVVILVVAYTPWFWIGELLVMAIAWSRVRLGEHAVGEVLGGIVLGSATGAAFALLTS